MRLLLIVNPAASSVTPRTQVLVQRALGLRHEVRVAETTRRNHATRLAEDAARNGVEGVVVLGGDGTVNEVANGIAQTPCVLIPLPGGSTNVFCRTLGLPDDPHEAVTRSLTAIESELVQPVGIGSVNGRYFLFHTGVGFDAAVVEQVERQGDLKRYLNHPLFVYAAVKTWLRHYDRTSPAFALEVGDAVIDDGYFLICLNTDPYTYLGNRPLNIAPAATLDRGLATVTLTSLRSDHLVRVVGDALRPPPGLRSSRYVDVREDVERARLTTMRPVPVQVDGDFIGATSEIVFEHHPGALQLVRTDLL
ncbi:MAG: diacylglycerol kinase family protein [Actinomycetota bacterium]